VRIWAPDERSATIASASVTTRWRSQRANRTRLRLCQQEPSMQNRRIVDGPYRWRVIDGAGHFPHEERPEILGTELTSWLADPEPER